MKITLVEVTDYKKVKKIVIAPGDRSMVLIAGKNRQGKSSLIGAMSAALGGGKEAPEEPIRKGQKKAEIKIEMDDGALSVVRKFHESGSSSLEVRSADGKLASPQKILDRIVGTRFLDPLKFSRLPEKEQREVLLKCVDLGLDLDAHAEQRKEAYRHRADANRDVRRLKAELESTPAPKEIPEATSADELLAKLTELTEQDAARINAQHKLEEMRAEVKRKKAGIGQAEALLEEAKAELVTVMEVRDLAIKEAEANIKRAEERLAARTKEHVEYIEEGKAQSAEAEELAKVDLTEEIEETRKAISEAASKNEERVRLEAQKEKHDKAKAMLELAEKDADAFNTEIEELDQEKATALAEANMPIDGLDVDEERVIYDGVPLSQASGAEQLQVSLAIAAALSPELRDIWVEDGALLDQDSLKLVHQFAKDNDLRIWLERVGESDDDCVIIEEGVVKT